MKSKQVICVKTNGYHNITINKTYIIRDFSIVRLYSGDNNEHSCLIEQYAILNDLNARNYYDTDLFITIKEYRKQKLNKINER